jgi:hypothetical protein
VVVAQPARTDSLTLQPSGTFLSDSIKIGYPLRYALSLRHPAGTEVIFPDSSFSYGAFEWVKKEYYPTRTEKSVSIDSVVYTLRTFEIDTVQRLALPVFIIHRRDCTAVFAEQDSVRLQQLIKGNTDTLLPRINTSFIPVPTYVNYPFIGVIIVASLALVFLIYLLFGKRIGKRYRLYRMSLQHRSFIGAYEKLIRRVRQQVDVGTIENAVVLWKEYMEWLKEKPFSTYTTKEIIEVIPDPKLAEALQDTDRIIYGQIASGESVRSMRTLEYIAIQLYKEKRTYIENQKVNSKDVKVSEKAHE